MCKSNLAAGISALIVGLLFFIQAIQYGFFSITSDGVPGAGFFPVITGGILILSAIILIIKTIFISGDKKYFRLTPEQRGNIRPFVLTIAGIAGLFIIWRFAGFYPATIIFCLLINLVHGRTIRFNLVYSAAIVCLIYAAFTLGLNISFRI